MELHGFDDPKIVEVLRKLKRNFYLVNLHFNNWSCTPQAAPLPAWAYQVLWVNKRIGVLGHRESRFFDTLENQIRKNGDTGRRLIIKMDIEGAEWDSLVAAAVLYR